MSSVETAIHEVAFAQRDEAGERVGSATWVWRMQSGIAVGPRIVKLDNGELLCSFMAQTELGSNDMVPHLTRSSDNGSTWSQPEVIWPELSVTHSAFCSISKAPDGKLYLHGFRTKNDGPEDTFWEETRKAMKENQMFWSVSMDEGHSWSDIHFIPFPFPTAAEAAGPMWVTKEGTWLSPFSPYRTFDENLEVPRDQVVVMRSQDEGRSWEHASMLAFDDGISIGAESWVVELSDGRLLSSAWRINAHENRPIATPYSISHDQGHTWSRPISTGIPGQTISLEPLADGRAILCTVRRDDPERAGIYLNILRPDDHGPGVESETYLWSSSAATQSGRSADFKTWTDFSFGEPSMVHLEGNRYLCLFWYQGESGAGILKVPFEVN